MPMRFLSDVRYVVTGSGDLIPVVALALLGVQLVAMYVAH
jgi:hypothetical protein